VRLVVTSLWVFAAVLWLGWALIALRLLIDTLGGVDFGSNPLFYTVFVPAWPKLLSHPFGPWDFYSWWPLAALSAMGLVALGWRLYWLNENGLLYRPAWMITLSVLFPLIAPFLMLGDAQRRHKEGNQKFGVVPERR
jgi:hypothetical protein